MQEESSITLLVTTISKWNKTNRSVINFNRSSCNQRCHLGKTNARSIACKAFVHDFVCALSDLFISYTPSMQNWTTIMYVRDFTFIACISNILSYKSFLVTLQNNSLSIIQATFKIGRDSGASPNPPAFGGDRPAPPPSLRACFQVMKIKISFKYDINGRFELLFKK